MAALQALRAEAAAARRGMETALAEALAARASITDSTDFSEVSTTRTASAVDPFLPGGHGRSSPHITPADGERDRDSDGSALHTHHAANTVSVGRLPSDRLEIASASASSSGSPRPGSVGRRGLQRGSGSVRSALSMRRSRTESETSAVSGTRVRILDDGLDLPSTVV